jgi:hypothetical protein
MAKDDYEYKFQSALDAKFSPTLWSRGFNQRYNCFNPL